MSARDTNQGLVYLRRSTGKQEKGLPTQLDWAVEQARLYGVQLDATRPDLEHMLARGLTTYKAVYLDHETGANLERAGFTAFRRRAMADRSVSHLFIHMPDRFARPQLATAAMQMEQELLYDGLAVVFSTRVSRPRDYGLHYPGEDIEMMFSYIKSSEFLQDLAVRVLQVQGELARRGWWTGGRPPYGFARVRVFADGTTAEMPHGTSIRQAGSHTELRPADAKKIAVWMTILQWCSTKRWGTRRIANELNALGVPSPDAGRTRTERGIAHPVSGLWTPSTVRALIGNTAVTALLRYGVQSEGHHRRLGAGGNARLLQRTDKTPDGRARVVQNPEHLIIAAPMPGFAAPAGRELYDECQRVLAERGRNQRGVPRGSTLGKYPLSTRVWDLACGYPMYGRTSGERRLYTCSRYMTSGTPRKCHHNQVDAEAALRFVLGVLRQKVEACGGRAALRSRLLEIARRSRGGEGADGADARPANPAQEELRAVEVQLAERERDLGLLTANLGRSRDAEVLEILTRQYHEAKAAAERLRRRAEALRTRLGGGGGGVGDGGEEAEVDSALGLYDQLERLITGGDGVREEVRALLGRLNLNLWLSFGGEQRGKRTLRVLRGGVITTGDAALPVRPYGGGGPGGGAGTAGSDPAHGPTAGAGETPVVGPKDPPASDSFTKCNRGDRIRTCGLLVPNQTLYQAELRPATRVICLVWRRFCQKSSGPLPPDARQTGRNNSVDIGAADGNTIAVMSQSGAAFGFWFSGYFYPPR